MFSPLPCSSHWCFQQVSLGPSWVFYFLSPNLATRIRSKVSGVLLLTDLLFWLPEPGAVGHLSFTEILDTSLKVSWQEPVEKNGIITGKYQLLSPWVFLSMCQVKCIIAAEKYLRNRAFRESWLLRAPVPWSLFWVIEMSARACYSKYRSNYWQLMIVVTVKAVCDRNQLPVEFQVLLNPLWPPPAMLNFWNFVRQCLAFAPKVRASYLAFRAAKSRLALLRSAIKSKPEISSILHLWSSGLAVDCVAEFACHYFILYRPSQGFRTLLFLFDELAVWQAIYLFTVCHCRYNISKFIIFS